MSKNNTTFLPQFTDSPCLDCPDRHPSCHSECEKYLEFRKRQNKKNHLQRKKAYYDRLT